MAITTIESGNFWLVTKHAKKFSIERIGHGDYRIVRYADKRAYRAESLRDAKRWIRQVG